MIRPASEIVTAQELRNPPGSAPTYLPANGLTLGAASAVDDPTSRTAAAPSAASAMLPKKAHRVIDRVIVHLVGRVV